MQKKGKAERKVSNDVRQSIDDRRINKQDRRVEKCERDKECREECVDDFGYIVTPFPEAISNFCKIENPYILWICLSLILLVARVSSMILCGEEYGRFAINIIFSLLPGTFACLIIFYSKQTENTTEIICRIVEGYKREEILTAYEKLIKTAFSNRAMVVCGIVFLPFFLLGLIP